MKALLTIAILIGTTGLAGAQERLANQLRKGIVQEEVNQDLTKAIEAYQAIVAQFDQDRKAAASALFRLAECSRKAGKREQAVAAYQRVVREFSDQASLAEPSRRQLELTLGQAKATGADTAAQRRIEKVDVTERRQQAGETLQRDKAAFELVAVAKQRSAVRREVVPERTTGSPEETKIELEALAKRLADTKTRVEIGLQAPQYYDQLQTQYRLATERYNQQLKQREADISAEREARVVTEQMIKSIQSEISLVLERINAIQKRVGVGTTSPDDPELLQLRRDLLGLQRKLDELRSSLRR